MKIECPQCHLKMDVPATRNYPNPFFPRHSAKELVTQVLIPKHRVNPDTAPTKTWMNHRAIRVQDDVQHERGRGDL